MKFVRARPVRSWQRRQDKTQQRQKSATARSRRTEFRKALSVVADEQEVPTLVGAYLMNCVQAIAASGRMQDDWERECFDSAATALRKGMATLAAHFLDQGITPTEERDERHRTAACQVSMHDLELMKDAATVAFADLPGGRRHT